MTAFVPLNLDAVFGDTPDQPLTPADLPPDQREWFEERAGIMESDGGMTRTAAEMAAFVATVTRMTSRGGSPGGRSTDRF